MAITEEDIQEVLAAIKEASQDVKELDEAATLDGVSSLPAVRGSELVSVPLALLQGAVLDLGSDFDSIAAFEDALGTEAVIRSGKSLVVGRRVSTEGYESLYLCLQAINADAGTGRQYVFANNNDAGDAVNGWRVRDISGVRDGSYTPGSWSAVSGSGGGTTYDVATQTADGLMSATDKKKLDGIEDGATKTAVVQTLKSGTKIAEVGGVALYAPETSSGSGGSSTTPPAVVAFDGIDPGENFNLSQPGADGETELPVFFDTFEEADNYGGYDKLFTPKGIYWCTTVKEPDNTGTEYGRHRFFLIGTKDVPLQTGAGGTLIQTVAVKTWEDGDVAGYPGSWAYNEDDAADGYARRGVLFQTTDAAGTLYYRAYGSDDALTELVIGS